MTEFEQYFGGIISGKIVACDKMKKVSKLLMHEFKHPKKYHFDYNLARKHTDFIELFCKQPSGKIGKPLELQLFQKARLQALFGFVDKDNIRQFNECLIIEGRKNGKTKKNTPDRPANKMKYAEQKSDITTGFLTVGYLFPPADDVKASTIGDMLAIILGEGQSSRLYQNLIEKVDEPYFNLVSADYYSFKDGGNFFVQANFKPEKKEEVLDAVKSEIKKLYEEKISENELKKAVKKLKSNLAQTCETVSDIGEMIGFYMTVCKDPEIMVDYINILEKITAEDIQEYAKEYLDLDKSVFAVLMPEGEKNEKN